MSGTEEIERLQEQRRLASLLMGIVNKAEICVSKLQNGFVNGNDYSQTKKTVERLRSEILEIDKQIEDKMNGEEENEKSAGYIE